MLVRDGAARRFHDRADRTRTVAADVWDDTFEVASDAVHRRAARSAHRGAVLESSRRLLETRSRNTDAHDREPTATPSDSAEQPTRRRPNVLFVITDQQRADHVGFAGNPVVRTPNIDSIAARGTVFDHAWVANPVCMPNRSTIMTGRMPSAHGVIFNDRSLDPDANTFVAPAPRRRVADRPDRQVAPPARHEP